MISWCGIAKRLKQKIRFLVHTEDNNIFTMHRAMHVLPKYITNRFYPSGLRGNATAQVRLLSLLAFGELHISVDVSDVIVAWKKVDGISKMKSMNGGKVTAR